MKNLALKILINLLLFQDDLSAWFWLFPFVLWEIIYSDQVCAGTTTSILYPRQQNLFPQNQKIFPTKIRKSSERGNLWNPARAELQIRWKKILANPAPHGARLSSASSNWNHISRSIFSNHLRNAKKHCNQNVCFLIQFKRNSAVSSISVITYFHAEVLQEKVIWEKWENGWIM